MRKTLRLPVTIVREIQLPAEIELQIDVLFIPDFPGKFNPMTGDVDPPAAGSVEVITDDTDIINSVHSLFDYYKNETTKQLLAYLESEELKDDAHNQYHDRGEDGDE